MATTTTNTFEGGTAGSAITTGNSGGGSGAAYTVTSSGAPTLEYSSTQAMHGSLCAHYVGSSGNTGYLRREHTSTELYFARRFYFRWNGAVTNSITFLQLRDTAGSPAVKFQALTNGSGRLQLSDAGGTNLIFSSVTLVADRWYRLEVQGLVGSTTSNGILNAQLFGGTTTKSDADGTTPLQSVSSSTANLGTVTPGHWRLFGASGGDLYIDSDTLVTDSSLVAALGAYSGPVNVSPTITGPGVVNTTGSTASLTFQGNDTDGTISSFALVNQSNTANTAVTPTIGAGVVTNPNTANASVTFPVSGMTANAKYFFGATATDNSGATSSTSVATVNVTKDIPDVRQVDVVGFTVVGGGTPLDAIVQGNAQAAAGQTITHYLESTAPPGGASIIVTFQPMTPSSLAKAFAIPIRAKDTTSVETAVVTLKMNDSTTIATRPTTGSFTLTTTAAALGGTTTTGAGSETAAITDHSKLSIVAVTS